jgi:hypothetical protein
MTAAADYWLTAPILLWFVGCRAALLFRAAHAVARSAQARSALMGRIVTATPTS